LLWNKALFRKMLVFGHSFNSRILVDAVKRASALGSMRQKHFRCFMRCLAANDSRCEALTSATIVVLPRVETQVNVLVDAGFDAPALPAGEGGKVRRRSSTSSSFPRRCATPAD
jgi:hypothetical protein